MIYKNTKNQVFDTKGYNYIKEFGLKVVGIPKGNKKSGALRDLEADVIESFASQKELEGFMKWFREMFKSGRREGSFEDFKHWVDQKLSGKYVRMKVTFEHETTKKIITRTVKLKKSQIFDEGGDKIRADIPTPFNFKIIKTEVL